MSVRYIDHPTCDQILHDTLRVEEGVEATPSLILTERRRNDEGDQRLFQKRVSPPIGKGVLALCDQLLMKPWEDLSYSDHDTIA